MPITVEEKYGRRLSDKSAELTYVIRGTNDDASARAELLTESSLTHDGLQRDDVEVEEIEGLDAFIGTVRYDSGGGSPPQTGESSFSFDTGGGTQHITQSLSTPGKYGLPGETAPDFKGAIGVTHDNVEGVDTAVPVYNFSETHYLPNSQVTTAYKGTLFALTGKVNNASFRGLASGECLFLGASGSKRSGDSGGTSGGDWEVTFRFAGSPNKTNLTIGGISGINKKGWEYLWVRYADAEDTAAKVLIKKPIAVYVERVYEDGSFGSLGI